MGEGKRASRAGQLSATITATMGRSSTSVWHLIHSYVDGWVEGCLERIGEDYPEEEQLFRDLFEDETQRDVVIDCLKADCAVRTGKTSGPLRIVSRRLEASPAYLHNT